MSICPISFSSHLQPTILFPFISWALWMLLQCMFVGWGCGQAFSMVLVSQILWDWNCHMTSSDPFFESKALWQSCPSMFWSLIYHQWHIRDPFTNITLLFLVYRVLDSGLFGFSLILCCSLIFRITDNKENEAHFQRLLSKYWLVFTFWSFLPDGVVCSCFYFGVRPLAIL